MEIKDDSSDIAQRLEKLNQWQEEQKKMLLKRQDDQRKLLGLEQRKMYEMFGILQADTDLLDEQDSADETSDNDTTLGVSVLDQTADDKGDVQHNDLQQAAMPKRPFLRRKQGLMNRFKVDPDDFRLNNLPPYKFSSSHPSLKGTVPRRNKKLMGKPVEIKTKPIRPMSKAILQLKQDEKLKKYPNIDLFEEKFQKSLISSKTACNSTPDIKSNSSSIKESPEPISWATILDPQNIKPIEKDDSCSVRQETQETTDETDNLSIFELLEKKAKDGSFDLNSSCVKRFLRSTQKSLIEDAYESSHPLQLPPVPYEVSHDSRSIVSDSSSTADEVEYVSPRPSVHVRFADAEKTDKAARNISDLLEISDASEVFEEFKKLLFASQNDKTISEDSPGRGDELTQEILQKTNLIKVRLQELESEIATFKQNNLDFVKSKQQHELEKAHFDQERTEALEKLNDERIQMEIYFHDERMKIEDERKKMEKQIRNQRSVAATKEKREMTKLREDLESLQKELKKKEELHIAAQSRLRTQVKSFEKDVRQLNLEIEALTKENKRLEAENLQINRQNNNKMLQEINRNIAKLAPKTSPAAPNDLRKPEKISTRKPVQPKPVHRRSVDLKPKASVLKRNSPVTSSDEDLSATDLDETERTPIKVFLSKAEPPPKQNQANSSEALPISPGDASFKREIRNPDGSKDIWYPNGNLKKICADGMTIRMLYFNKDIKETNINEGTVKYYYAETNTWHTTYLDGLEILEFPNGQTEHRYKDGKTEIHFPNSSIKIIDPSDEHKLEEWRFADGTNLIQMKNGDKVLLLPNGQKEIHTPQNKRREYPDGTVKLVYPDGSQETRYSNGRVRLKDKDGNLVVDTENNKY